MQNYKIEFNKENTLIIKGFAIIFMILLHVFGGSGWYDDDLPMNHQYSLLNFMHSFQICVAIYAFLIGYGYYFAKNKDYSYSFKHIKKLLSVFWLVMLLFVFPVISNKYSGKIILLNLFGIDETLLWVTWFVYLFIFAMFVFPLIIKVLKNYNSYVCIIMVTLVCYSCQFLIYRYIRNWNTNLYWKALFVCVSWFPIIVMGYLFAKENVYENINNPPIKKNLITSLAVILFIVMLLLKQYVPGYKIIKFDMIYVPIIIYCILIVFTVNNLRYLRVIMKQLGDKSVYMWFIHALFFTSATRPIYHKFIMISDNLWIIALWTIVLSYIVSCLIKCIVDL